MFILSKTVEIQLRAIYVQQVISQEPNIAENIESKATTLKMLKSGHFFEILENGWPIGQFLKDF